MSSAPAPARTYKVAIVALLVVIVVLVGVIAQMQRSTSQAGPGPSVGSSAPAAVATDATQKSDEQVKLESFLVNDFPRREEGDPLAMGNPDAKVVLTEWSDFRCPFCSVWAEDTLPALQPLLDDGTLRIEFRDLAIFGDESVKAATAARAAGEQDRFFEFSHALFTALPNEGHPDIPDDLVMGIVDDLGLDAQRFTADWADPAHKEAVLADSQEAQSMGVSSTPSFVIGGQFVSGALPLADFQKIIAEQAALVG